MRSIALRAPEPWVAAPTSGAVDEDADARSGFHRSSVNLLKSVLVNGSNSTAWKSTPTNVKSLRRSLSRLMRTRQTSWLPSKGLSTL